MLYENHAIVTLEEGDLQQASTNGGTPVDLPPFTTRVFVRVAPTAAQVARGMTQFPAMTGRDVEKKTQEAR